MKKITTLFILAALLSGVNLEAQSTGNAAVTSSRVGSGNNWQNWVFATSAMATAAAAIFVVSMHNGNHTTGQGTAQAH